MKYTAGDKVVRNIIGKAKDEAVVLIPMGEMYKVRLIDDGKIVHWHTDNMKRKEVGEVGYKAGDRVVRNSLGGRGNRGVLKEECGTGMWKVTRTDKVKEEVWHTIHFGRDPSPVPMPPAPAPMAVKPAIGIGCKVTHTAHKHGVLVGTIVGDDINSERWEMSYESGKTGSWLKKYCAIYDVAKDNTLLGENRNPCGEVVISSPRPGIVVCDDPFSEVAVNHDDIADSISRLRWVHEERAVWQKNFFNNPIKSEEDTMKLEIKDYTTVNGLKTDTIGVASYIEIISGAEAEVKRLEALQEGSEAIAKSSAITNTIKELKASIERCVGFMDKAEV